MPEQNNFYAKFCKIGKTKIKEAFEKNDWTSSKASWTDFELTNNWSELILEGDENEPLLNGMVAFHPNNLKLLDEIFYALDGQYAYEFCDKEKNLIFEKKSAS